MAGNIGLRNWGKTLSYLGVIFEMYLIFRKPFEGNLLILGHVLCLSLLVGGVALFKKNV